MFSFLQLYILDVAAICRQNKAYLCYLIESTALSIQLIKLRGQLWYNKIISQYSLFSPKYWKQTLKTQLLSLKYSNDTPIESLSNWLEWLFWKWFYKFIVWIIWCFCQCNVLSNNHCSTNSSPPSAAYMRQWVGSSLVQVMASRLFGAKPLPEPMLAYCQLDSWKYISVKFEPEFYHFH